MQAVYNLEKQVRDKLGRVKKSEHVGVFRSLDDLERVRNEISEKDPTLTFEVYSCEHILFESQPS